MSQRTTKKPHGGTALLKWKRGQGPLPHPKPLQPVPVVYVERPNTNKPPQRLPMVRLTPPSTGPSNHGVNRYDCGEKSLPKNTARECQRRLRQLAKKENV